MLEIADDLVHRRTTRAEQRGDSCLRIRKLTIHGLDVIDGTLSVDPIMPETYGRLRLRDIKVRGTRVDA